MPLLCLDLSRYVELSGAIHSRTETVYEDATMLGTSHVMTLSMFSLLFLHWLWHYDKSPLHCISSCQCEPMHKSPPHL